MRFCYMSCVAVFLLMMFVSSSMATMSIEIIEPEDGAYFAACSEITVKAKVEVTDETIRDVRFYYNGNVLGRARSEPWETTEEGLVSGNYELTAKVLDSERNEVVSEPVHIKVGPISSGEKLFNGGFNCGDLSNWTVNTHQGAEAAFQVFDDFYFDDPHYLYVDVQNGSDQTWHIQLNQNVPTDSGHTYEIFFLADAESDKTINYGMQENQDPWESQIWESMTIEGLDFYGPFEFTAIKTDPTNQFRINVGGNDIDCFFDSFSIIDRSMSSVEAKSISGDGQVAKSFKLNQAFPNPFNMNTTIQYELSAPASVKLAVYNMKGQKVKTLVDGYVSDGVHRVTWNGTDDNQHVVPSGVYFYRLTSPELRNELNLSHKLLLIK